MEQVPMPSLLDVLRVSGRCVRFGMAIDCGVVKDDGGELSTGD
jgi:hypothetical protein